MTSITPAPTPRFILDFETTGLDPATDQVLEVGLRGAATIDALISDARPTSSEAEAVHGLDPDLCRCLGRPSTDVLDDLLGQLGPGPVELVAHNASFERRFLEAWAAREGRVLPEIRWQCTLEKAWALTPEAPFSCRLGALAELFGWPTEGLHGAGIDAALTERLVVVLEAWTAVRDRLGSEPGLIYLAGPFRGDGTAEAMAHNRARMAGLARWAQAVLPRATMVVPHLNFAFADEAGKHGDRVRAQVLQSCEALMTRCQALIQCGSRPTEGMAREIAVADRLGLPVLDVPGWPHFRREPELEVRGVA
jgi:hypothetical protein